jgi:hypothetical protein
MLLWVQAPARVHAVLRPQLDAPRPVFHPGGWSDWAPLLVRHYYSSDVWKCGNDQYVLTGHVEATIGHSTLQSTNHPFILVCVCFQHQQSEHKKQG